MSWHEASKAWKVDGMSCHADDKAWKVASKAWKGDDKRWNVTSKAWKVVAKGWKADEMAWKVDGMEVGMGEWESGRMKRFNHGLTRRNTDKKEGFL